MLPLVAAVAFVASQAVAYVVECRGQQGAAALDRLERFANHARNDRRIVRIKGTVRKPDTGDHVR